MTVPYRRRRIVLAAPQVQLRVDVDDVSDLRNDCLFSILAGFALECGASDGLKPTP